MKITKPLLRGARRKLDLWHDVVAVVVFRRDDFESGEDRY